MNNDLYWDWVAKDAGKSRPRCCWQQTFSFCHQDSQGARNHRDSKEECTRISGNQPCNLVTICNNNKNNNNNNNNNIMMARFYFSEMFASWRPTKKYIVYSLRAFWVCTYLILVLINNRMEGMENKLFLLVSATDAVYNLGMTCTLYRTIFSVVSRFTPRNWFMRFIITNRYEAKWPDGWFVSACACASPSPSCQIMSTL